MRMIRLHMQMIMIRRIKLQIPLRQTYLIIKPVQLLIIKIINHVTNTENTRIVAIIKCVSHFFFFYKEKFCKSYLYWIPKNLQKSRGFVSLVLVRFFVHLYVDLPKK